MAREFQIGDIVAVKLYMHAQNLDKVSSFIIGKVVSIEGDYYTIRYEDDTAVGTTAALSEIVERKIAHDDYKADDLTLVFPIEDMINKKVWLYR